VNFVIVAFILFLVVRGISIFRSKEPVAVATPPKIEVLLEEIRDILAAQRRTGTITAGE
jgi:large conductance mechanosensitive channel